MERCYNLLVIGTGVSGSTVAMACRDAGWKVAIADNRPFGGTCALRGCHPKKILSNASEIIYRCAHLRGKGLNGNISIDWQELIHFKKSFTDPVPSKTEETFQKMGIDSFHGTARFIDGNTMQIKDSVVRADHIVLAAGSIPKTLNIRGEHFLTFSNHFLDLEKLPSKIVFVGGGYISFEFAHIALRAGARVTIVHNNDNPLHHFDSDIVEKLLDASKTAGISYLPSSPVRSIEKSGPILIVKTDKNSIEADIVVHGAGRVPYVDDLSLDRGNVGYEGRKIIVNEYLQSITNPSVYVIGDFHEQGLPFTPSGIMEGKIVAENLLKGNCVKPNYSGIPQVLFTNPRLAMVGSTEVQARNENSDIEVRFQDTSNWKYTQNLGLSHSAFKLIIDKNTHKLKGVHLLGQNADEVINIFALAIRLGLTVDDLKTIVWTYPTLSSDISYMLD